METPQQFTDRCAINRGLQVIQRDAPWFAAHIEQIRENMLRTAEECARQDFLLTAKAMNDFAKNL